MTEFLIRLNYQLLEPIQVFLNILGLFLPKHLWQKKGLNESRFSYNHKDSQCSIAKVGDLLNWKCFFINIKATCTSCHGSRYAPELLEVKYKNKSINEVLNLSFLIV